MSRRTLVNALTITLLSLAFLAISLLLLRFLLVPLVVWLLPSLDPLAFDLALYGPYRSQSYVSFALSSPRPAFIRWHPSCDDGYLLLDVNGPSVAQNSPVILDARGDLVWMSDEFDTTMNLAVQTYRHQNYLTFWSGRKSLSSGQGAYYMLDDNYTIAHQVHAVGQGLSGDLHEFKISRDDTALITVYNATTADMSDMGMFHSENDHIVDSIFQEIEIETGDLLFQWKASDHFKPSQSFKLQPFSGYSTRNAFDFFHINSVEKDSLGNFLISSRHFHSVIYIDGQSGEVIWVLGGILNDFLHLSGEDEGFGWQHDARWVSEANGTISLFDNGEAWPQASAPYSQGRIIQLDVEQRTVDAVQTYRSLQYARSSSQGSLQVVPVPGSEPHVLIGWGSSAVVTEHSLDGEVLCEMHFGAAWLHFWERVKSYRAFKATTSAWKGRPIWSPSARVQSDRLYVSWNGATEVHYWELQRLLDDSGSDKPAYEPVDIVEKTSFETSFALPLIDDQAGTTIYRVAALDDQQKVLNYSNSVEHIHTVSVTWMVVIGSSLALAILALGGWALHRRSPRVLMSVTSRIENRFKYQKLW